MDYVCRLLASYWFLKLINIKDLCQNPKLVAWRIISRGSGFTIRGWAISSGAFQLLLMMELSGNQFDHHYWWKTKKSCIRSKVCLMIFLCLFLHTGLAATTWKKRHVTADVGPHLTSFAIQRLICHLNVARNHPVLILNARTRLQEYIMLAIIPTWAKEVLRTQRITPKPWRLTSLGFFFSFFFSGI